MEPSQYKAVPKTLGGPLHTPEGGEGHPSTAGQAAGVNGAALVSPCALGHLLQHLPGIRRVGAHHSMHCIVLHAFLQQKCLGSGDEDDSTLLLSMVQNLLCSDDMRAEDRMHWNSMVRKLPCSGDVRAECCLPSISLHAGWQQTRQKHCCTKLPQCSFGPCPGFMASRHKM